MKKILPLLFFVAFATTSYAQIATFAVTTAPCNHNGILSTTFSGVTPPLTVTYTTYGTMGTTIIHTGVTGLTDALTGWSGGPVFVVATDLVSKSGGYYAGMPPFTDTVTPTAAICPALGSESATVTGGTPPYTYSWFNEATSGIVGTTNPITLPNGTYGVEITDAAGCVYGSWDQPDSSTLTSIPTYTVGVTTTVAACTNGTATSGVPAGTPVPPYTYLWSNGATTPSISGLVAGVYLFTMTDAVGCSATAYADVTQSITITAPIVPTPATCVAANGAVIAFGSGGVPPYSYIWSNGATTQSQAGLAAGFYGVNVTDANGCIGSNGAYVGSSTPITVTYSTTPTLCTSPTGTATVAPAGGTGPYTIQWYTTPPQTGITAISLLQGPYNFKITDAVGCTQTGIVVVPPIDVITGTFTSVPAVCTLSNGSMSVVPAGGVLPYTYSWSTGATASSITSAPASLYHVTITDNLGCTVKLSEYLPEASTLSAGVSSTPASCIFVNDGTATATGIGGTPPYSYAWTGGGSTGTITSLPYGPYWVWVRDALGCLVQDYTYVGYDTASFCYCTIAGTVYYDINGNCTQDIGEPGIPNIQIKINSGKGYTYTDNFGHYSYKVPTGSYTVSENVLAYYPLAGCQLNNIPVSTVSGTGCVTTVDFANAIDTIHDMHICTWDYNKPVPGNSYTQVTVISNKGTIQEPAVLANYNPDGQLFAPTFVPGGVFSGSPYWYTTGATPDTINAGMSQSFLENYVVPTDIPLATTVLFWDTVAYATPVSNWLLDFSPWNNINAFSTVTVAWFDPNFKEVYPKGTGTAGIITYSDTILQYMVHFQNTGTAPAENIIVKDTLDNNLDWTSLTPVFMSAQGQVTLDQEGGYKVATFTFRDINLPAASTNAVTSNGMFTYSIHTNNGLPIGTQFKNSASIYFDYNAPIKTNQTLNTLGSVGPDHTNTVTAVNSASFSIFPNPANNSFTAIINSDMAGTADMRIADVSGRTMIAKNIVLQKGPQTISVDVNQLSSGVYFVSLMQNGKSQTQKLVVIKQ